MANRRMIYQDFFEDEYFGTVEPIIRLFWIGLITAVADDQGRILDNSALIRAKVFMYDPDITTDQIDKWLSKLNEDNKIVRYEAKDKHLIQIVKWWEYQTPAWASPSKYPAPDKWTDRVRCHVSGPKQGGSVELLNWEQEGGYVAKQTKELRSKQGSKQTKGIDDVKLRKDNDNTEAELVKLFCNVTSIPVTPNGVTYEKWKGEVSEWIPMNITAVDIKTAYDLAIEKGYTVARPGGLTNFIRGNIAKQNSDKNSDYPEHPPVIQAADGFWYDSKTGDRVDAPKEVVNV